MRERLHILFREPRELITFHPRPGADICDRVFALAVARYILAWRAGVFARELNLKDAVDAEGFVAETFDGIYEPESVYVAISRDVHDWDLQGIFSFANLVKWFTWPWYGAPLRINISESIRMERQPAGNNSSYDVPIQGHRPHWQGPQQHLKSTERKKRTFHARKTTIVRPDSSPAHP